MFNPSKEYRFYLYDLTYPDKHGRKQHGSILGIKTYYDSLAYGFESSSDDEYIFEEVDSTSSVNRKKIIRLATEPEELINKSIWLYGNHDLDVNDVKYVANKSEIRKWIDLINQ